MRVPPIILGVQIEARRLDRGVPQVPLDEADVGAGVGLVRGGQVAQPVRRGASERRRAGWIARFERGGRPPERLFRDQVDRGRRQVPLRVASDAQDGGACLARCWCRRQPVEGAIAGELGHQRVADWHLAFGTALANHMQPPAPATLEEIGRLRVRGLARAQRRVVEEAHHPAATLIVLALARRSLRPGLHGLEHDARKRGIEIPLHAPDARRGCGPGAAQRERVAGEVAGGDQIVEEAREDAERLAPDSLGEGAVEEPPGAATAQQRRIGPIGRRCGQKPLVEQEVLARETRERLAKRARRPDLLAVTAQRVRRATGARLRCLCRRRSVGSRHAPGWCRRGGRARRAA